MNKNSMNWGQCNTRHVIKHVTLKYTSMLLDLPIVTEVGVDRAKLYKVTRRAILYKVTRGAILYNFISVQ